MPSYSKEVKVNGVSSQDLYQKVSDNIDKFLSKTPIGNYELKKDPGSKTVSLDSKMATLNLACQDGVLKVNGKLSLLAVPFKSKLDEGIEKWISKTFQA